MNQDFFYAENELPYLKNLDEDSVSQIFNPFNQSNKRKCQGYSYYSSELKSQQWAFPYQDFSYQPECPQNSFYQSYNLKRNYLDDNYHDNGCNLYEGNSGKIEEFQVDQNDNSVEALIDSQLTNSSHVEDNGCQNIAQRYQKKSRGRLGKFTEVEDRKIMEIIRVKGLKFKYIAKLLPGKTPMMIKNRYYKRLRQIMNEESSGNNEAQQIKVLNDQIINIEKQLNETKMEIFRELLNMMDFESK